MGKIFMHLKIITCNTFLIGLLMFNTACSTTNTNIKPSSESKLSTIINNKQSMTVALKKLNNNFSVNLLYSGIESDCYKRLVALKLESTTVLVAVSSTKITNQTFLNILSSSSSSSIGLKLFAPNSQIKRDPNMDIKYIEISQISSLILQRYLISLNYKLNQTIIQRTSTFYYKNESMKLFEYILPSINQFI